MKQMNLRSSLLIGLLLLTGTLMGQTKKSFTLDDLMWGGSNYWNLQPKNLYTAFWGSKLMQLEVEAVKTCTDEKGKRVKAQTLFTAADVKALITDETKGRGLNLMQASFPYPNKTLAFAPYQSKQSALRLEEESHRLAGRTRQRESERRV